MKKYTNGGLGLLGAAVAGGFLLGAPAVSAETNFNYSSIAISAVAVSFDDDIVVPREGLLIGSVRYSNIYGAALSGSYQVDNNWVIRGGVSYLSNSGFGTSIESSGFVLGGAYVIPTGPSTDVIGGIDFIRSSSEVCTTIRCVRQTENGYGVNGGVRHWATTELEVNASLNYAKVGDFGSTTSVGVGGAYWFNNNSSIAAGFDRSSDETGFAIGYRYAF